jgi:hypothetical protein
MNILGAETQDTLTNLAESKVQFSQPPLAFVDVLT